MNRSSTARAYWLGFFDCSGESKRIFVCDEGGHVSYTGPSISIQSISASGRGKPSPCCKNWFSGTDGIE